MIRHCVTDRRRFALAPDALVAAAATAVDRGAHVVQIREPDLADALLLDLVIAVVEAVRRRGARVLVNDRTDVAIAGSADGVHLRGDSAPASRVRAIVPPGFTIGRSVHTLEEIDDVAKDGGCDYVTFGTVFPSAGKPPDHPVAGLAGLAEACRRSPLPVIAIGGITRDREAAVMRAGAAGLAAVALFM